jgi:hypothetical protein
MKKLMRIFGIIVQALLGGFLFFIAVSSLIGLESGARVFRYQGF